MFYNDSNCATFSVSSPQDSGGVLTINAACFCAGTRIATPGGEVAVEALHVGDLVTTLHGEAKPIRWIGTGCSLIPAHSRGGATPVIVRAGALADGVPCRDLRLTGWHCLYLNGVLVPVEALVNGRSILWDQRAQVVEFFHIELAEHDVLIADGAPAESYREDGSGLSFLTLHPDEAPPRAVPCAEIHTSGPAVERLWHRLDERAGKRPVLATTNDPDLHLLADGMRVDADRVESNAYTFCVPRQPRTLRIVSRGMVPCAMGLSADSRPLGVALSRIVMRGRGLTLDISIRMHRCWQTDSTPPRAASVGPTATRRCLLCCWLDLPARSRSSCTSPLPRSIRCRRHGRRWRLDPLAMSASPGACKAPPQTPATGNAQRGAKMYIE